MIYLYIYLNMIIRADIKSNRFNPFKTNDEPRVLCMSRSNYVTPSEIEVILNLKTTMDRCIWKAIPRDTNSTVTN